MPLVEFNAEDINRSRIVEPAYYRVRIDEVEISAAKKGNSINYRLEGVIVKNADTGDVKFAGVPTPYLWMYNSKLIGNMVPLLEAMGETVGEGYRLNTDNLKGKEVEVFIGNAEYNGNIQNSMTNKFRAVRA